MGLVTEVLHEVDPNLAISEIKMMTEALGDVLIRRRLATVLLVAFASLALLLAVVGLYGVIAQLVQKRTPEIGVRIALGATRTDIVRMFVGRAVALAGVGIATGVATALTLGHLAQGFVFGIATNNPVTLGPVIAFALLSAMAAAAFPTWRALKVAPAAAIQRT